jgi:glycosyltransferase involved in cell wall biosynthesis
VTRVLLDAVALSRPSALSGIGTYQRRLLEGLGRRADLEVEALAVDAQVLPPGVAWRRIRRSAPGRFAVHEHDLLLPLARWRSRADVFHNPTNQAPRSRPRTRWVQTLFDVIPLTFDDPTLAGPRRRLLRGAPTYRAADAVIAISRHAADTGIRTLGLDPARVHVVHLAADPACRPGPGPATEVPYLLVVSAYDRRKGFREAFEVISTLAEAGYPHRLVVAGALPPWVRPEVEALRDQAAHPERIDLRGYADDLVGLYRGADAMLVTSRAEGFGLPALEAMACGTPVVAFDNTSLPEVVGDGGVLVPDGDVPAFVAAVRAVLDSAGCRAELRERGLARAATFSWERCVDEHVSVYRAVAG